MEKRAVVTTFTTPGLKEEKNILKKNADAFDVFMDKMMKKPSKRALDASKEDEKTFEDERK